jgi:hypothetical protein
MIVLLWFDIVELFTERGGERIPVNIGVLLPKKFSILLRKIHRAVSGNTRAGLGASPSVLSPQTISWRVKDDKIGGRYYRRTKKNTHSGPKPQQHRGGDPFPKKESVLFCPDAYVSLSLAPVLRGNNE